ncbi:MAG: glycogen/starch/alpha-glucan phosphorylase, partial [Gloeomargarita sp. DG_1_6_bins_138]
HPAITVAELMRLLIDEYGVDWDTAWEITTRSCAYTNHTLLPEALERWPLGLFASLLPRHLEIIYEINQRFLDLVQQRFPGDTGKIQRMSLIDESGERYVRMANLATVGSMAVNGVAALHTDLLKQTVLKDFYDLWPDKFQNKTNGVTPRRWMLLSNLRLSKLIASRIGKTWVTNYEELQRLEEHLHDPAFCQEWRAIKQAIKADLVGYIQERTGILVNPDSIFDVQIKRIHEYKRQHLQALHIVALYNRLKRNPDLNIPARTFLFGGKAAPGYFMAKLIIKLINSIGEVVNNDPQINGKIKVVFLPDYNVKFSQRVFPAADLSEQISTAGKEASGTGNMKFAMNGALTIGTLDGANVEIREKVGAENFFLFGLNAQEVMALRAHGYRPWEYYNNNPVLKEVIDQIAGGVFSRGDTSLFRPIVDSLLNHDPYFLLADFQSFLDCQEQVNQAYQDTERWTRMSILNTARTGFFSSDRSMQQYCQDIWHVSPVPIEVKPYDHAQAGQHL